MLFNIKTALVLQPSVYALNYANADLIQCYYIDLILQTISCRQTIVQHRTIIAPGHSRRGKETRIQQDIRKTNIVFYIKGIVFIHIRAACIKMELLLLCFLSPADFFLSWLSHVMKSEIDSHPTGIP